MNDQTKFELIQYANNITHHAYYLGINVERENIEAVKDKITSIEEYLLMIKHVVYKEGNDDTI